MFKYLLIIFLIFILSCSNSKNENNSNNKVEIILSGEDNNIEIKKYNESELKELALESLKEFLSLPYDASGVWTAYEKFYSSAYKEILNKSRNIKDADDYVLSEPSLDFEFETTIDKVYSVELEGKKAYIEVDSSVYDRVENSSSKARQTFVMEYEDDKWVISR
ncbi:hypothetical protein [Brachyspira catarrhinii]|uniref:DUF4348 domain-containing protein n=1 Tax=Brachyspira catarrhinii TaxID=2528966 RepID=A0ABY2TU35_9SPIR|nr:hypothetical protein [Brachyspira catarrhinii]TKZ36295.1 hypothetical protein EZH24_00810 [Brachyspira catarrhinii]